MRIEQVRSQRAKESRGRFDAPHGRCAGTRSSAVRRRSRRCAIAVVLVIAASGGTAAAKSAPSGSILFNSQVNTAVPAGGMIGGQPAVDTFPQNLQDEPSIALDPATGALIAGGNDAIDEPLCSGAGTTLSPGSCAFAAGVGISGVYRSSDGGRSWTQPSFIESPTGVGTCQGRAIHTLPGYCEQNLGTFGDPSLTVGPAMDSNGRFSWSNGSIVYYGNLAFPSSVAFPNITAPPVVAVSRSMDDGLHWAAPVLASSTANPVDFNDKDYVWADANPSSPHFGTVYSAWTLFKGKPGIPEPIVFSRSTDGGKTWSHAMALSSSADSKAGEARQDSFIRTGPDGTVYVFWRGTLNPPSQQLVAISHDGGASFQKPIPVVAVNPPSEEPSEEPGSSFRHDAYPSVDVNQANGAIYLTWANQDEASATTVIDFSESKDGGKTWSAPITVGGRAGMVNAFFPSVAASPDGHHVFVAWAAQTWEPPGTAPGAGVVSQFAAYNLRTDGAWSGGHMPSTASGDPDGSSWPDPLNPQFLGDYATAVSNDSTAWFVWTDTRNEAPCSGVDAFRAETAPEPNPDLQCAPTGGRSFGKLRHLRGSGGLLGGSSRERGAADVRLARRRAVLPRDRNLTVAPPRDARGRPAPGTYAPRSSSTRSGHHRAHVGRRDQPGRTAN